MEATEPVKGFAWLAALVLVAAACSPSPTIDTTQEAESVNSPTTTSNQEAPTTTSVYQGESFAGTVAAPEFPDGLDWINTDKAFTMAELEGKVVLLDFWTYGCVNCIHVIPDLKRLEDEYPNELVVIGVHSAKFSNEGNTDNIKNVVQRYGIEHPVINDKDFAVWNLWGAQAWPTTALIDPAGKVVGTRSGEGVYDVVNPVIAALVSEFNAAGALNREPIEFALEADSAPNRPLSYPGKVLASDGRLWVSDTGHNRVLELDPATGDVLAAYGSGVSGRADGNTTEAEFKAPQGLALGDGVLYVADTNSHRIRSIDLASGDVSTLAGTGRQGWPPESASLDKVSFSTPWDLVYDSGSLYVANAGTHQIWVVDIADGTAGPLIGNAAESTTNGSFSSAELAQPSGLALDDNNTLFFADSESSSIRSADLDEETTSLVVGGDANLFEFGDVDGAGTDARLQHPLGVAVSGEVLYVADTYNSKIKRVDTANDTIESWLGGGSGWADGNSPLFDEPGGVSIDGDTLYVADTNNHAVRAIDITTGETTTLVLKGVEAFDPPAEYRGDVVQLAPQSVNAGQATIVLDYVLPDGYKVNEDAPSSVSVSSGSNLVELANPSAGDITGTVIPANVPVVFSEGSGDASIDVTLIYCQAEATSLCLIDQARYDIPLEVGPTGPSSQLVLTRSIQGVQR